MSASTALNRLLSVASPGLARRGLAPPPGPPDALAPLWAQRNGWIAFWSAVHVFPLGPAADGGPDAGAVNDTLVRAYGELAAGHVAFAQDLFGTLFTWHGDHVCAFDPETADHEPLATDLEGWATALLDEPELAGSAFAFDWQERHGPLEPGERLVPLLPFALDGGYDDANLEPRDTLLALRERAALARVLVALPDGAEVEWPLPGTREEPGPSAA